MDPYPEIKSALKSDQQSSQVIPPPDLPQSPPPLSQVGHSAPFAQAPEAQAGGAEPVNLQRGEKSSLAGIAVPFNTRLIAGVIDVVVTMGVMIGLSWIFPTFLARLGGLAYMVLRDSLPALGGQSVGKKAMKLKAVTLQGESLSGNWEAALIRNGVLLIPLFALLELFILLTRENKLERGRRLGDEWAKTRVQIEEKPPTVE